MYVTLLKVERQIMLAIKMILSAAIKFTCSLFSIKVKNYFFVIKNCMPEYIPLPLKPNQTKLKGNQNQTDY